LTAALPFTGERFTPETRGAIWYEHWHRYCAALPVAAGKRVLDCACGEGYGSWLLAGVASKVIGVDIDGAAIAHATARYGDRANLAFVRGSCTRLPVADASVDLVVSFETIEHIAGQEAMLAEFARVLGRNGALVISSPNKAVYPHRDDEAQNFHVRELTREELASVLTKRFPQQLWYGQRVLAHSLLWAEAANGVRTVELVALDGPRVEALDAPAPPMYFLVICGAEGATLPRLPALSVFDDGAQSLYGDYERALLEEKRLYWEEVDARKVAAQRLQETVKAVNDLASAWQREALLGSRLESLQGELARVTNDLNDATSRLRYRETWRGWVRWPLSRLRRLVQPSRAEGAS
jgi:SAM-dependent methyltransferase